MNMYHKYLKYTKSLYRWVISFADHPLAIPILCVVAFTEASFFIVPPDVLLIAMSAGQPKRAIVYAHWCVLFSVLGALFGYVLGWAFWSSIDGVFFAYLLTPEQFEKVQMLFQDNTFTTVLLAAFTPIPFKAFTIIGGVMQAPLLPFISGSILGRGLRYYLLALAFFIFGKKIKASVEKYFEKVTLVLGFLFLLIVVYFSLKIAS